MTMTDLSQGGVTETLVAAGCTVTDPKAGPSWATYAELATPDGRPVTVRRSMGLVCVSVDGAYPIPVHDRSFLDRAVEAVRET